MLLLLEEELLMREDMKLELYPLLEDELLEEELTLLLLLDEEETSEEVDGIEYTLLLEELLE
jgi:hypothetical protein